VCKILNLATPPLTEIRASGRVGGSWQARPVSEPQRNPWPRFGLVALPGSLLPRSLAKECPALTVPSGGIGACQPRLELMPFHAPDGRELICFASRLLLAMCLDPVTGQVVDLVTDPRGNPLRVPSMVNSSLDQFTATVRAATVRFPFHADAPETDPPDFDAAANRLRAELEPIDPAAWQGDLYWETFYWDVAIGDYSLELFEPQEQ